MNYETKYFKYKQKYLDLKQSIMTGGALPFEYNRFFYVMAKLGGGTLSRVVHRREALGITSGHDDSHMTFLNLIFNFRNRRCSELLDNEDFRIDIVILFKSIIRNNSVEFVSRAESGKQGVWEIFGRQGSEYFARVYTISDDHKEKIRIFRELVITKIIEKVGPLAISYNTRGTDQDNARFQIYSTADGIELFAINLEHYGDINTWKPHISLFSRKEIKKILGENPIAEEVNKMFRAIPDKGSDKIANDIRNIIGDALPISNVYVNGKRRDFSELRISHSGYGGNLFQKDYVMFRS